MARGLHMGTCAVLRIASEFQPAGLALVEDDMQNLWTLVEIGLVSLAELGLASVVLAAVLTGFSA